jgi:hypothetical protein
MFNVHVSAATSRWAAAVKVTEIFVAVHDTAHAPGVNALMLVATTFELVWVPFTHTLRVSFVPVSDHATRTSRVVFVASLRDMNFSGAVPHVVSVPFTVTGPSAL